jgi:hypothetical protein
MSRKITFFACLIVLGTIFLASCENDERAVVSVVSMNNNDPFTSDVADAVALTDDWCPVTFYNRPYSSLVATGPGLPYNDFLVTRYRVTWRRTDGGTEVPAPFEGALSVNVPSTEQANASILLVPGVLKTQPPLSTIGATQILAVATVTFYGYEVGTDNDQEFTAEISVTFADYVTQP